MEKFEKAFLSNRAGISILDFLADELPLSKTKIKDAMQKGAVWLIRDGQEPVRVRRATEPVKLRDDVHIYYDESFLNIKSPGLQLVADHGQYSLWIKPAGLMDEVTLYGDHMSLGRLIERDLPHGHDCFFIDPESPAISGLMLLAHTRVSAAKLLEQQKNSEINKDYRFTVAGRLPGTGASLKVEGRQDLLLSLDHYNGYKNESSIVIQSAAGIEDRLVALLCASGYLLPDDEQLECCCMAFRCPVTGKAVEYRL